MRIKKKIVFLIIFLHIIGIIGLKKLFSSKLLLKQKQSEKYVIEKLAVKAQRVRREELDFILSYVGGLKAKDEVYVFSKAGGKLASYLVHEGDTIEKGQPLALVDRDQTGLKYELAKVESPLSGIVGMTLLDKGQEVSAGAPNSTALALIVNMDEMTLKLGLREQDISYIQKGLKAIVSVDAYPNEEFTGEVSKVSEVVDTPTRTLPIEITIPNADHRLKSGMFARIKIFAQKHSDALVVLQDALVKEDSSTYVYVAHDAVAKKIKVKVGILQDNKVEVLEGLAENDQVIVFGQQGLRDGSEINIVE